MLQLRVTKHNGSGYHFFLAPESEANWRPLGINRGCDTFVNAAGTLVYVKVAEQPLYTRSVLLQIDPEVGMSSHSSTTWEGRMWSRPKWSSLQ